VFKYKDLKGFVSHEFLKKFKNFGKELALLTLTEANFLAADLKRDFMFSFFL
jgi:hypothetical protein